MVTRSRPRRTSRPCWSSGNVLTSGKVQSFGPSAARSSALTWAEAGTAWSAKRTVNAATPVRMDDIGRHSPNQGSGSAKFASADGDFQVESLVVGRRLDEIWIAQSLAFTVGNMTIMLVRL